jgi:geranylgeranyl transferase type-1 subunit beta
MTLAYFLLASLDLLGTLETATTEAERQDWVEWVWQQQSREVILSNVMQLSS